MYPLASQYSEKKKCAYKKPQHITALVFYVSLCVLSSRCQWANSCQEILHIRRVFPHFLPYNCSARPAGLCPALESYTGVTLASLGWGCRREKGSRIQLLVSLCWLAKGTCSTGVSAALQSALEEANWIIFLFIIFWTRLQTVAKCFVHVGWIYVEVCLDLTRWVLAALCLPQIIHRQPFQGAELHNSICCCLSVSGSLLCLLGGFCHSPNQAPESLAHWASSWYWLGHTVMVFTY